MKDYNVEAVSACFIYSLF